jgi:fumarate reductase subunit D
MRRSHAPIFWLLFGAGGMLAALVGTALVFVTGIAGPLGWMAGALAYPNVLALARGVVGKAALFAVVMLFAWHAAHRLLHSLHDVGIPLSAGSKALCYGAATVVTGVALVALLAVGF